MALLVGRRRHCHMSLHRYIHAHTALQCAVLCSVHSRVLFAFVFFHIYILFYDDMRTSVCACTRHDRWQRQQKPFKKGLILSSHVRFDGSTFILALNWHFTICNAISFSEYAINGIVPEMVAYVRFIFIRSSTGFWLTASTWRYRFDGSVQPIWHFHLLKMSTR